MPKNATIKIERTAIDEYLLASPAGRVRVAPHSGTLAQRVAYDILDELLRPTGHHLSICSSVDDTMVNHPQCDCGEFPPPKRVVSVAALSRMFQAEDGDESQKGSEWRKGWNSALRLAMDYAAPPSDESGGTFNGPRD